MRQLKFYSISILLFICLQAAIGQSFPAGRFTDWSNAGYRGNVTVYPVVKKITDFGGIGNGVAPNDSALQAAISSLANQKGVILFPAGNFYFSSPVTLRENLIIKGAGASNTTLLFNLSGTGNLISVAGNATGIVTAATAAAIKESHFVEVANSSLFSVKDYVKIYQTDTAVINDSWAIDCVGQIVQVDSIAGKRLYFSGSVLRKIYTLAQHPSVQKIMMVTGTGIECLKLKRLDASQEQTSNISFNYAANCWVQGVESDSCNFAHVQIGNSTNIEVVNSYFHGAFAYGGGGQGYGVSCEFTSGDCLVENNVFKHLRHSMLLQAGANGNVFAYNYSLVPFKTDSVPADLSGDIVLHGNYPYQNLFEGNIVQNIIVDASHGINGPFNTFFRNRASLYGIIISPAAADSTNIIGNEITGTGYGKGNYYLTGSGNLQYANNKNDTILPINTGNLTLASMVYTVAPHFWNGAAAWPGIGLPAIIRTGSSPSKERYSAGADIAFCSNGTAVMYSFIGSGNWSDSTNWSNGKMPPVVPGAGSEIIIDPTANGQCILNTTVSIPPGVSITVKQGKKFIITGKLSSGVAVY